MVNASTARGRCGMKRRLACQLELVGAVAAFVQQQLARKLSPAVQFATAACLLLLGVVVASWLSALVFLMLLPAVLLWVLCPTGGKVLHILPKKRFCSSTSSVRGAGSDLAANITSNEDIKLELWEGLAPRLASAGHEHHCQAARSRADMSCSEPLHRSTWKPIRMREGRTCYSTTSFLNSFVGKEVVHISGTSCSGMLSSLAIVSRCECCTSAICAHSNGSVTHSVMWSAWLSACTSGIPMHVSNNQVWLQRQSTYRHTFHG